MPTQIQLKRGTAASMAALNLTLAAGEPGLETDTRKVKIGDGTTAWNSLRYVTDPLVNTPTTFSADQNNYALPATADIFRISASTPITISGIVAGYDGQQEMLRNVGSTAITLAHNSANSTAGNRFAAPQSENFVLPPNGGIAELTYDATSAVWRINPAASHTHGSVTNDGRIGTISGQLVITTTGGALSAVSDTKSAYAQVATYAAMRALGTPAVMTVYLVTADENKNASNTIYQVWPNGVRLWIAALAD